MTIPASTIAQLRRMTAEPTTTTYSDAVLTTYIENYPIRDSFGNDPDHYAWVESYDLNVAAADIWEEKAAALQERFDFSADGGNFSRSQQHIHALSMAGLFRSRRQAKSSKVLKRPIETDHSDPDDDDHDSTFYVN